jgi:hypothetical protein
MADTAKTDGRTLRDGAAIKAASRLCSGERLLTPKQAAHFLCLSTSWLAKARMRGDGPPYSKLGRFHPLHRGRGTRMDEISPAIVDERRVGSINDQIAATPVDQ